MEKLTLSRLFILYSLIHVIAISGAYANTKESQGPEPVEKWFKNLKKFPVPKTKFMEFYVQDRAGGPKQSVWEIARSSITSTSPTTFGQLFLADSTLTVEPNSDSLVVGQGQGLGGFSDLTVPALYLNYVIYFTSGKYNGSTITISGRNQVTNYASELSIVGGTGYFRMARGVAITSNYAPRNALGIGILKYTLYFSYF